MSAIIQRRCGRSVTSLGACTIDENVVNAERRGKKKFNVSHRPFPMIPLSRVVIDNLHLFLRVADVLIDLLIVELKRDDAIEKVKKFQSFNPEKYKHLDKYQNFVSSLGIPDASNTTFIHLATPSTGDLHLATTVYLIARGRTAVVKKTPSLSIST